MYIAVNPECMIRMMEEQVDQVNRLWFAMIGCFCCDAVLETSIPHLAQISGCTEEDVSKFIDFWVTSGFIVLLAHDWQEAPPCIDGSNSIAPKFQSAESQDPR